MEPTVNQMFEQAIKLHREGKLEEAERLYRSILKIQPEHIDVNNNLGALLYGFGRFEEAETTYKKVIELQPDYAAAHNNLGAVQRDLGKQAEAEASYKKAIEFKPDYAEAHNNLGNILKKLKRPDEAEASYKKAIGLKLDYAEAHNNLGNLLYAFGKFDDAEVSLKKAIELKPDFAVAYNNMGNTLRELGRFEEAEINYKKAIEINLDFNIAHNNLNTLLREKKLKNILQIRKLNNKVKLNKSASDIRLTSNLFTSSRAVETELITTLYKIKSTELNKIEHGPLFGMGRTTNYQLFENDFSILKTIENDLTNIMKQAVKSDIHIMESFFNILKDKSGSVPHTHISSFDKIYGLSAKKFSLVYYISIGDQDCMEPGIFKLKNPDDEILPSNGMVLIIPADRKHSAVYNGKKDRVMIGVNFYSLL